MWKELIQDLSADTTFYAPVSPAEIAVAEHRLAVTLPDALKELWSESDGVHGEYGLGLIWPLERIVQDNLKFRTSPSHRTLYMPFEPLLFFADAGNGDQFAFVVLDGAIRRPDVFVWNHEDDSRVCVAPSLKQYLEWWLTGKLKV